MIANPASGRIPSLQRAVRFWRGRAVRTAGLPIVLAVFLTAWLANGALQLVAQVAFSTLVVVESGMTIAQLMLDLCAQPRDDQEHVAWSRQIGLIAGVAFDLLAGFALLVTIYPALRRTPVTAVVGAILAGGAVLALAVVALLVLLAALVFLYLPVLIVRWRYREWRRRY